MRKQRKRVRVPRGFGPSARPEDVDMEPDVGEVNDDPDSPPEEWFDGNTALSPNDRWSRLTRAAAEQRAYDRAPDLSAEEIAAAVVRGSLEIDEDEDALFLSLAREHLHADIETLAERGSDGLDFVGNVPVAGIRRALLAAYTAGKASR